MSRQQEEKLNSLLASLKDLNLSPKQCKLVVYSALYPDKSQEERCKMAGYKNQRALASRNCKILLRPDVKEWLANNGVGEKAIKKELISINEAQALLLDMVTKYKDKQPFVSLKAMDMYMKSRGAYINKTEVTGDMDLKIEWGGKDEDD